MSPVYVAWAAALISLTVIGIALVGVLVLLQKRVRAFQCQFTKGENAGENCGKTSHKTYDVANAGMDGLRKDIADTRCHGNGTEPVSTTQDLPTTDLYPDWHFSGTRNLTEDILRPSDTQLIKRPSTTLTQESRAPFVSPVSESVKPIRVRYIGEEGHWGSLGDLRAGLETPSPSPLSLELNSKVEGQRLCDTPSPHSESVLKDEVVDEGIRSNVNDVFVDAPRVIQQTSDRNLQDIDDSPNSDQSLLSCDIDQTDHPADDSLLREFPKIWADLSYGGSYKTLPNIWSEHSLDEENGRTATSVPSLTGNSLSSYSVHGENEPEEDDDIDGGPQQHHIVSMLSPETEAYTRADGEEKNTSSDSMDDSAGSSPGCDVPAMWRRSDHNRIGRDLNLSSDDTKSISDLCDNKQISQRSDRWTADLSLASPISRMHNENQVAIDSTTTERISLSCISDTAEANKKEKRSERQRQEARKSQFRHLKKAEKKEGRENVPTSPAGADASPGDLLSDELSPPGPGEKTQTDGRGLVLEKKTSMIGRLQKKGKNDRKVGNHNFITIAFSRATACDVCGKNMANKRNLHCTSCLVNVHKSSCKDQLSLCNKNSNLNKEDVATPECPVSPCTTEDIVLADNFSFRTETTLSVSETREDLRSTLSSLETQPVPDPELGQVQTSPISGVTDMSSSESLESLDGVAPSELSWLESDLQQADCEPEDWQPTGDSKKKFTIAEIKRQNHILVLINSEKQHVKRLKIMQKIFAHVMLRDLNYTKDQVSRLFPRLNELVELHAKFLQQLLNRQAKNEDKSVDAIGDILIDQFQGSTAEKMKSVYGVYCSKHQEAMQLYKEFMKSDKKFENFVKNCSRLPVCGKHDISDFILSVTVRITKYPILIDSILNYTNDKKDRLNVSQALLSCNLVVKHVDDKVHAYQILVGIQNSMDSKTINFRNRKFKRQDLNAGNRELVHAGKIGWKSARGQVYDVLAVVLTDLIVFLQNNEQKYTFLMQDNKSCVIPLHNLVVKEKNDVRHSLGIYIISQNRVDPEMYELVCKNKAERQQWITILQEAITMSLVDEEAVARTAAKSRPTLENEVEKQRKIEHANKVRHIVEKLHLKDGIIKECCADKSKLMLQLLELSATHNESRSKPHSLELDSLNESVELVHAAIKEASRLTDILQSTETQLSRSISEHQGKINAPVSVPKRADTFSGFDRSRDLLKKGEFHQKFAGLRQDDKSKSPYILSPDKEDRERSFSDTPDEKILGSTYGGDKYFWKKQVSSETLSDHGALEELPTASASPLVMDPSGDELMTSIFHLVQYLNVLMSLTSKQCTKVESLRAELAEAKEEIVRLSADAYSQRSAYGYDQLEELKNLQENITQEKEEWERTRLHDFSRLEKEREALKNEWSEIEKEKVNLRNLMEELKREQENVQRQISERREQDFKVSNSFGGSLREADLKNTSNNKTSQKPRPIGHYRSASADFDDLVQQDMESFPSYSWEKTTGFSHQSGLLVDNLEDESSSSVSSPEFLDFPYHLMSASSEQSFSDDNCQSLPPKRSEPNNMAIPIQNPPPDVGSSPASHSKASSPIIGQAGSEGPASYSVVPTPLIGQVGSSGILCGQPMTSDSRSLFKQQKNSQSIPSDLSKSVKFAEPNTKSFSSLSGRKTKSFTVFNKPAAAPQSNDGLASSQKNEGRKRLQRIFYN